NQVGVVVLAATLGALGFQVVGRHGEFGQYFLGAGSFGNRGEGLGQRWTVAGGFEPLANSVVEYLVVTNRFDGLGLEDDRGGDFIGAQATGLDGLVAIFAGALVEGIDQRVDCDVVVIFNFHQA